MTKKTTRTPSIFFLYTEGVRTLADYIEYFVTKKSILKNSPKGNGEPIIVIPGFMSDDGSSKYLRRWLNTMGYRSEGWGLGKNKGFDDDTCNKLISRIEKAHDDYKQPIKLIGWSLGGAYSRVIANLRPDLVSEVITVGGPVSGHIYEANNVRYLFKIAHKGKSLGERSVDKEVLSYILSTPIVKTTAIYSKFDGVIHWTHCMDLSDEPHVKNIEVFGSHSALFLNVHVFKAIAETLHDKSRIVNPFSTVREKHFWEKIEDNYSL